MAPVLSKMEQAARDGKCPACEQPGHVMQQQISALPSYYYISPSAGAKPVPQVEEDWACAACAIEWRTVGEYGKPSSRRLFAMNTLSRPFFPAARPLAIAQESQPEKPPTPEPEQTIHGSVIGYRAWRINTDTWRLQGTGANHGGPDWMPGINEAVCRVASHPAPDQHCHCGFNALARFDDSAAWWGVADVNRWAPVVGAIEAWSEETVDIARPGEVAEAAGVETNMPPQEPGRFILHGTGFRAQFGKVVLLAVDNDWPVAKKAAVRALAREHEADVCKRSHLEDAAKEHGQLVPDEMLAWAAEGDPAPEGGGYLVQPLQPLVYPTRWLSFNTLPLISHSGIAVAGTKRRHSKKQQGISQTLGYPGPPANPTSKFSKGQRVKDSKGVVWACVKGGKPGLWELEE